MVQNECQIKVFVLGDSACCVNFFIYIPIIIFAFSTLLFIRYRSGSADSCYFSY